MKLTVTIEGLATLPRFDATRLTARLQSEIERELQATAATTARSAASAAPRANARSASPWRGEGGAPSLSPANSGR